MAPPVRGGGMPHRIMLKSRPMSVLRTTEAGNTPGVGARLPTYRLTTRNSAAMAAWFVVMLSRLHIRFAD